MEITNDLARCPQGHSFNAQLYTVCPICGAAPVANTAASISKTMPASAAAPAANAGNAFPHTTPPQGASAGAPAAFNATMPVNNASAAPAMQSFVATQPGGDLAGAGQAEPVVGWLVCIDGPVRGVDFRLHAGYNYIGREVGDIHIHGDNQISREKHAVVAFYPKRQSFNVAPAEGLNIIELNGEPVFNAMEMKNYDVLTIGNTQLMLVALCGEHFQWKKEQ